MALIFLTYIIMILINFYFNYIVFLVIFNFCLDFELSGFVLVGIHNKGTKSYSTEYMFHMLDNVFVL